MQPVMGKSVLICKSGTSSFTPLYVYSVLPALYSDDSMTLQYVCTVHVYMYVHV